MTHHYLENLVQAGQEKGFEIEQDVDYGAGPIDVVWKINPHSALPDIKLGFVTLGSEEGGSQDTEDNQLSLRKIEEAAFRGIRSGLDKIYLVTENQEMAKSVSGKIEWLASHGSLIRLDAISLGLYPEEQQEGSSVITPSQQRVPEGEKIRKQKEREREEKFDKYNRPQGERREKESEDEKMERELSLDENSRPKGQKKVLED